MFGIRLNALVGILATVLFMVATVPASAQNLAKLQEVIDQARTTFNSFLSEPNFTWFRDHIKDARAILIIPRQVKAGFILAGSGGSGVALARDERTGRWSQPAFFTMGSGSIGLQIGGAVSQVILIFMTERGRDALLSTKVQLGADIKVAAGPIGAGAQAATTDVLSFARSKGFFGGISVEGAVIEQRDSWNDLYYGRPVRAVDILIRRNVSNMKADSLVSTVTRATSVRRKRPRP
jgi:lipid-binding SYLF domain-containing protein